MAKTQNPKKRALHSQDQKNNPLWEHGKIPPQAVDLEETVLGAIMLEQSAYLEVANVLKPDCFYKEAHQIIYTAIEALARDNEPIDILTVTQKLLQSGKLDLVGGPYYITQLTNRIASAANVQYHAFIVFQKFVRREIIRTSGETIKSAFEDSSTYEEVTDLHARNSQLIDELMIGLFSGREMAQIMDDHAKVLLERFEKSKENNMVGIPSGISDLDRKTNGFNDGDLIIVAARPSMGKTALALNQFTKFATLRKKYTCFFSIEMTDITLADRLVCSFGNINSDNMRSGRLESHEWEAYHAFSSTLQGLPLYIDDSPGATLKHIKAVSRSKKRKGDCDMIVIDYLQLIEPPDDQQKMIREQQVAKLSKGLKSLAKELSVPIILLCQLSRAVESRGGDKEPMLSDLRESGSIEQDADIVIFPYRAEYYKIFEDKEGTDLRGIMKLIIAKNRNGSTGEVFLRYSHDLTKFSNYEEETPF